MSRHRDVRNIDLDDYADDDDYDYDEHDDGAYEDEYRPPVKHTSASSGPKPTDQSTVIFKTKPAKKAKGGGGGATNTTPASTTSASSGHGLPIKSASTGSSTSYSRPPPGFHATTTTSADLGGDDFDAETARAIAASLAESKQAEAFRIEAGLAPLSSSPPSAKASSSRLPPAHPSHSPTPIRSEHAARETELALEQLRLEKRKSSGGVSDGGISTPKRQLSSESPSASPPPTHSPTLGATKFTGNLAPPFSAGRGLTTSVSANTLSIPSDSNTSSQPVSPRSPGGSSTSSSTSISGEVGTEPPPTVSAKRVREVTAATEAEASAAAAAAESSGSTGGENKGRLNMVVIGHVDAGKSTLMGHLLFLQGRVSKKLMHKYEKESKEIGKSSFHFAWVLDETEEERTRGITVDVAVNYFETPSKKITLLDAPGHKEFIPNMITGAAQADAAILVVPATTGEFEGGFGEDGQIREHAVLARSLGVSQLILAVNKLDTCGWSQARYNEIVGKMVPYLKGVGYKEKDVWPVPVSGLTGENIMECKEPELKSWYDGPVLLDLIDRFSLPPRYTDKPMRMCVQDVFKTLTLGQVVAGKIETGTILLKDRLLLLPLGETISVKAMERGGENLTVARAGDNIEIGIKDFSDPAVLQVGQWLCDPLYPIPMVVHFRAQIITMNYKIPLVQGTQLTFFTQAATEPIQIHSILSIIDKVTGAIIKKSPRVLPRQSTAIVELTSKNKICLELFKNYRELGRFTLRRGNETVAVGICVKLYRMS